MSEIKTFTAVILPSVEEQIEAGDHEVIDPEVVNVEGWEGKPAPVFRNGEYTVPDSIIGIWKNPRVEDGRLVADIRLQEQYAIVDPEALRFSFTGLHGGGQARLIAVHAHWNRPEAERA